MLENSYLVAAFRLVVESTKLDLQNDLLNGTSSFETEADGLEGWGIRFYLSAQRLSLTTEVGSDAWGALGWRFYCQPGHVLYRAFRGPAAAVAVDRVILVQVSYVAETRRSVSGVEHFSVPAPQTLTCKVFQGFEAVVGRILSIKGS